MRFKKETVMNLFSLFVGLIIFFFISFPIFAKPFKQGNGKYTVTLDGTKLDLFTYKPNCPIKSILLVFHGNARNAKSYRNSVRSLGNDLCALVVAPLFDAKRFPGWRYQRGGIIHQGTLQKSDEWTGSYIIKLVAWIRRQEGQVLPYALIGHSAGSQFLSRFAAFTPNDATHIILANPSTYVFADLKIKAPYGMGGVYPTKTAESQLKRYLAMPITILLGQDDVTDKALNKSHAALLQGRYRLDRGTNAFDTAEKIAQKNHWTFNWKLIVVPGVGHSAKQMFSSPLTVKALTQK